MVTTSSSTEESAVAERDRTTDEVAAIGLARVVKSYRSGSETVRAVGGVDLEIARGEFFSLLGPSGCGKTTTMRMIAGFEEPTEGVVRLSGRDVTGVPANHRDVNMVFQSYALFPHMSVAANVAFGLERKRVPKAEVKSRVAAMLELVELGHRARHRPAQLSGGQQQRVALARALVNEPGALLLDEPLGALDLKLRQSMQVELKRIQREVGITFVYVTHDQGEALTMSDRVAVMNNGLVEQLGTPAEIYERPATRFVADFIGTSNLLTGTVAGSDTAGRHRIDLESGATALSTALPPGVATGSTVHLTVRPEKVRMGTEPPTAADAPDGPACSLRGTVTETVYMGASTHYQVALDGGVEISVFRQNSSDSTLVAERGAPVWVWWDPRHSYALPS
ncbi:ABC transporter ATP-binding protein [Nocardiopsis sp. MG754419]|uniref:ABC transporter ATP-binding protein n=1 Tax=Nocardiopsis sp. MG754419 TaxID=2259865 RepID=UPI001BAA2BB8|nr:ABC transporter ATP-binding protein [Nocardiopsis sp. MG754419]MBR8744329.1 spermidine/putrescine ABC transporter ATP-binding protein [Nocardiopsis sp. MG754419]